MDTLGKKFVKKSQQGDQSGNVMLLMKSSKCGLYSRRDITKKPQSGGLVRECDVPDEVLQMWVVALDEIYSTNRLRKKHNEIGSAQWLDSAKGWIHGAWARWPQIG